MLALVTNDDGIASPGLGVLARCAQAAGLDVLVAAPHEESSGASAALHGAEEDGRLMVEDHRAPGVPDGVRSLAVAADPALIAFVSAYGAFGAVPDVLLSGVNRGPNVGNAVLHSGTVGAALSGATFGMRSLAVSLDAGDPQHWETAEWVAAHALDWLLTGEGAMYKNAAPPDRQMQVLSPKERALLEMFKELSDKDQREICRDAEEKKRTADLERRIRELETLVERKKNFG